MLKSLKSKLQGNEKVREFFTDELVNLKVMCCFLTFGTLVALLFAPFSSSGSYESAIYSGSFAALSFVGYQYAKWQKSNK